MTIRALLVTPLVLALCAPACATDAPSTDPLPPPPELGDWAQIDTGGETVCSLGTPYSFYVRGGVSESIIIDFRGGGGCWNAATCSLAKAASVFKEEVDDLSVAADSIGQHGVGGVYNESHPDYPFKDWTLVHVPYCTGDVHWGDNVADYGTLQVNHKGFVNASAVLDWVYDNYPNPEQILVTGCSAGAYGALLHSGNIADHYPAAKVRVLSDSGAGIITDDFYEQAFPNWGLAKNLPAKATRLHETDPSELTGADFYAGMAEAYPDHRYAHVTSNYDADQVFFYELMGGEPGAWPGLMRSSMKQVRSEVDNFRYYVGPGPLHCITPYDFMFDKTGDSPFIDWLNAFVYDETLPADVACEGAACDSAPLCDECAAQEAAGVAPDAYCGFCADWPEKFVASGD